MARPRTREQCRGLLLAGATAVGKSEVALWLAERLGGEIISVDSMQVYRGLDIGTAKPTAAQRQRVRHHLIDVVEVTEAFDAAQFMRLAEAAAQQIREQGRVPIFCGGTGLYFRAYLHGLGQAPSSDPQLREQLEQTPLEELCAELAKGDPELFARIDQKNPRRVIRAVEVLRQTGKTFSELRGSWQPEAGLRDDACFFALSRPAGELARRIETRVDAMFTAGLVAETECLLGAGLRSNRNAMQAIGYRQVVEYLDGQRSLAETIALVKLKTRQFARRQATWFRREKKVIWIEPHTATAEEIARGIAERYLQEGRNHART